MINGTYNATMASEYETSLTNAYLYAMGLSIAVIAHGFLHQIGFFSGSFLPFYVQ